MNAANLLSLSRIGVVPIIAALIWPGVESPRTCFIAMLLYAVAGTTDLFDGFLARRLGQVTVLGKFLDPLADKLLLLVTLVVLLRLPGDRVPVWVVLVMVAREVTITGLRAIAMSEGVVIAAGEGGKIKTTLATCGICGLLVHYPYYVDFVVTSSVIDFHRVGLMLTYLSVVFSITSAITYLRGFFGALPRSA